MTIVKEKTLMNRINRRLAKEGGILRRGRGLECPDTLNYYVEENGVITSAHEDLESLGRELKALKDYERLAA